MMGRAGLGSAPVCLATGLFVLTLLLVPTTALPACAETARPSQTPGAATPGPVLGRLATLLCELEEHVRVDAQFPGWSDSRTVWVIQLAYDDPSPVVFRKALQELELSVRASRMAEGWSTRRIAWYTGLRAATLPAQFADLMKQLEMAVARTAFVDAWAARRLGWHDAVTAAWRAGATGRDTVPLTTPTTRSTVGPPAAGARETVALVAELIRNLEPWIKPGGMSNEWRTDSASWRRALDRAMNVSDLRVGLKTLEMHIRVDAQIPEWSSRRRSWLAELEAATTPMQVARQLRRLEESIKAESMTTFYAMAQGSWRVRVDAVTGGAASTTVSPPTTPAATRLMPTDEPEISKLIAYLLDLENRIASDAQRDTWSRSNWLAHLIIARAEEEIGEGLIGLDAGLEPFAFMPHWAARRDRWRNEVRAADTTAKLKLLAVELERSLAGAAWSTYWDYSDD